MQSKYELVRYVGIFFDLFVGVRYPVYVTSLLHGKGLQTIFIVLSGKPFC